MARWDGVRVAYKELKNSMQTRHDGFSLHETKNTLLTHCQKTWVEVVLAAGLGMN